jgi:hypothetical protein
MRPGNTGDLLHYANRPGSVENTYFNKVNPLVDIPGGILDPSRTGANQANTQVLTPRGADLSIPLNTPNSLQNNIMSGVYDPRSTLSNFPGNRGPVNLGGFASQAQGRTWQQIADQAAQLGLSAPEANAAFDQAPGTVQSGGYLNPDQHTVNNAATANQQFLPFANGGSAGCGGGLSTVSRYVRGGGTGQSDSIPAALSVGEYIMDADTVASLGDGSNEAGARALDKMRETIRVHKRSTPAYNIPPKAKPPMAYLTKGATK